MPIAYSGTTSVRELEGHHGQMQVLDVREDGEFEDEGHISGAFHLYVGYLEQHLAKLRPPLDKSEPVAVTCSVGHRASLAVSIMRRLGYKHVLNLLDGMTAWSALEQPTVKNAEGTVTTPEIEGERS
mgnify:CR=1 FL=1